MAVTRRGENDNVEVTIEEYRRAFDEIPEEQKNSPIGKISSYLLKSGGILEIGAKIKHYRSRGNEIKNIQVLQNFVKNQEVVGEDTVKRVVDGTNLDWAKEKLKDFYKLICVRGNCSAQTLVDSKEAELLKLRDEFNRQLEASKREMAENTIINSSISSGIVIATQFVKLYLVWKDIRLAQNLTKASKTEIPEIEVMMTDLANETATIVNLMDQYDQDQNEEIRLSLAQNVDRLTRRVSRRLNETQIRIGDLKAEIGKRIERIDVRRDEQVLDGIINLAQGIAGAYQIFTFGGLASTGYRLLQGLITGSFFLLAAGNAYTFVITGDTLKELRAQMATIRSLTREVLKLQATIEDAEEWYGRYSIVQRS